MFRFEKLSVWRKSVDLADRIYQFTRKFPDDERYGLTSQMRRAAVSISSNIAEGGGRSSDKDCAHFVEIAHGSLVEVVSQAQLAFRRGFLTQVERDALYVDAEESARMISGPRASLLRSQSPSS